MEKKSKHYSAKFLAQGAIIAALYVVLTYVSALVGLSGQNLIQFRLSEVLTVLPFFTPAAVPGLAIGCLISNIVTSCAPWDIVFGTLATLIGAVGTYLLRRHRFAAPIPPILSNTVIVPFVVYYCYGLDQTLAAYPVGIALLITAACVFVGEFVCCGILGTILQTLLIKHPGVLGSGKMRK
ncbi:MAG: QueT transporter family protein [Clostridiales bacterium]|nr:QueT transporter family protein [Clostridiales bacterium]